MIDSEPSTTVGAVAPAVAPAAAGVMLSEPYTTVGVAAVAKSSL